MTLRVSTGLRNLVLGTIATVQGYISGTGLAFVDGGASDDSITDSGHGFITQGFAPGDKIFIANPKTAANSACNDAVLTGVTSAAVSFATATVNTAESGSADTIIAFARGGSLKEVMKDGIIRVYSGAQPASPDSAPNGTLLLELTESSGTFVHGAFDNGLEFGDATSGYIEKASAETWSGVGEAAAGTGTTAQSFRFCANPTDAGGSSTTLARIDGSVATSGGDLNMSTTTIVSGSTYTIDDFKLTWPLQYGA